MTSSSPDTLDPISFSAAHREDYLAMGHPLYWLTAGWEHVFTYVDANNTEHAASVVFPTSHFIADDLPSNFMTGITLKTIEDPVFAKEIIPANFNCPPYLDFRNDVKVIGSRAADLYPVIGVSAFADAIRWLERDHPIVDILKSAKFPTYQFRHRVEFPITATYGPGTPSPLHP